jgi:FKBP-type peptidyl-prolyl cis-trans isomerase (trigger factor)
MFDGKTLKYLKPDEVEDYKAAIERGRQLKQIDRQIEKLQQQLLALTTTTHHNNSPQQLAHQEVYQQSKVTFTDMGEQEHLVKEVLAESQRERDLLRQSGLLNQWLRTVRLQ